MSMFGGPRKYINAYVLLIELNIAKGSFLEDIKLPTEVMRFINTNKLQDIMSNLWVALNIMLTTPITALEREALVN